MSWVETFLRAVVFGLGFTIGSFTVSLCADLTFGFGG